MTTGKHRALTTWTSVSKVKSLLFSMLSSFVIAFLPESKRLLISWLQSPSAMILSQILFGENKICHSFHFFPMYLPWSDGTGFHALSFFECWALCQVTFTVIKRLFSSSSFSAIRIDHLHIWDCYFSYQSWSQHVIHPTCHFSWCTLHIC